MDSRSEQTQRGLRFGADSCGTLDLGKEQDHMGWDGNVVIGVFPCSASAARLFLFLTALQLR